MRALHPARPIVNLVRAHGISIRLNAAVPRRCHAEGSLLWFISFCADVFSVVAHGSVFGFLVYVLYKADVSKLVVSRMAGICTLIIHSFVAPVSLRMLLI